MAELRLKSGNGSFHIAPPSQSSWAANTRGLAPGQFQNSPESARGEEGGGGGSAQWVRSHLSGVPANPAHCPGLEGLGSTSTSSLKRRIKTPLSHKKGFSWWLSGKESACQCKRERGFDPWVGKIPWRRKRQPTPVLLSGKSHGQRILAG